MKDNIPQYKKDILINLLRKKFDEKLKNLELKTNEQFAILIQTSSIVNSITNNIQKNIQEKEEIKNRRNTISYLSSKDLKKTIIAKSNKNIINKTQIKNEKMIKSKSNGNLLNQKINKKLEKNNNIKTNKTLNFQKSLKRSKTERQINKKNIINKSLIKQNPKSKNSNNNLLSISKDKINNSLSQIQNSEILSKTFDENKLLTMESTIQSGFFFNENDPLLISPITEMDFQKNNFLLNSNEIEENYHFSYFNFLQFQKKFNLNQILKFLNIDDFIHLKLVSQFFNQKVNELILQNLNQEKEKYENKVNIFKKEKNLISTEKILKLNLSKGSLKAINLLNQPLLNKLFTDKKIPSDEILLIYYIYFQLINNDLSKEKNKEIFWEKTCNYFIKETKGKTGDFLLKNIQENLDLSPQNIYKIIHIVEGKVNIISPSYFSKICGTTGLFVFFIKDILDFLGITNSKKICDNCLWTCEKMINVIEEKINMINIYSSH